MPPQSTPLSRPDSSSNSGFSNLVAGLSVAGLLLPQTVAYAGIAGLSPDRGIAAAVFGGCVYAAIGRSRFAIIAPTSSSAALLGAALATLPPSMGSRDDLATAMAATVALLFGLMALFKLGVLANFIARPVLTGFSFGLAVTIIMGQLPALFGFSLHEPNLFALAAGLVTHLGDVHPASLALGGGALAALLIMARTRLPGTLIVLICAIGLAYLVDLPAHGIALIGRVNFVLTMPGIPVVSEDTWSRLIQLSLPITLIIFAESWGTVRSLALRHGDKVGANRELTALAASNFAAALTRGMPVGAGFSLGQASEAAGATGRMTQLSAALTLALLVLLAGGAVAHIPQPVLAAIVIAAMAHSLSLVPFRHLLCIHRDQAVAISAALGVIAFNLLNGMLIAIALSMLLLLKRMASTQVSELGRVGDGDDFVPVDRHKEARIQAGTLICEPDEPLFFANADAVFARLLARAETVKATLVILSLEANDDMDSSVLAALAEFEASLAQRNCRLRLTRVHDAVLDLLIAANMTDLAQSATFEIADAVAAGHSEAPEKNGGEIPT